MTDTMTPEQRHACMQAIKGKDTKPEMLVRRYLHARGYRYGLHNRRLPGCPDIVLRRLKTVIFIHGCFWHGHDDCRYYRLPKSNIDFWQSKIDRNKARDAASLAALEAKGWNVIVIWECELKPKEQRESTLRSLAMRLASIDPTQQRQTEDAPAVAAEPETAYGI